MRINTTFVTGMLVVPIAAAAVAISFAGSVTIPNSFVAGTPAVAAQVNANFAAVRDAVNDNDARIQALQDARDGTHYYSVNSGSFMPELVLTGVERRSGGALGGAYCSASNVWLIAPVHLPQGATVTRLTAYFDDTSSADLTVWLAGESFEGGFRLLAEVNSDTNAGYYSRTTGPIAETIDNLQEGYDVRVIGFDGTANLLIKGATIEYTLP